MLEVKFYDTVDDSLLKFAVIISQSNGKWVFCKHKERDTYEAPGGHREDGEDILETAKRELQEETGAIQFDIMPICVYSVTGMNSVNETGEETFGLLCFAEIREFSGKLESEIEKIELMDELPQNWTYPLLHPKLIEKYLQMNYTYILTCGDGTLYTGWTNDLEKRLKAHNEGKGARYTRSRRPVVLSYYEGYTEREDAMRREWEIKHLSRKEKLQLIQRFECKRKVVGV